MDTRKAQFKRGVRAIMEAASFLFIRDGATIYVRSDKSSLTYEVSPFQCSCPDYQHRCSRAGHSCKHMIALKLPGVRVETTHATR